MLTYTQVYGRRMSYEKHTEGPRVMPLGTARLAEERLPVTGAGHLLSLPNGIGRPMVDAWGRDQGVCLANGRPRFQLDVDSSRAQLRIEGL